MDQRQQRFQELLTGAETQPVAETPMADSQVPCPTCKGAGYIPAEDLVDPFQFFDPPSKPKREPAPPDYSIPVPNYPVPQLPPGELEPSPDARPLIPPKKKV